MTRFLIVLSMATLINSVDNPQWLIIAAPLMLASAVLLEALLLVRAGRTAPRHPLAASLAGWYLAPELASGGVPVALPNLATLLWLASDPALVLRAPWQPLLVAQVAVLAALALLLVKLVHSYLATLLAGLTALPRQPMRRSQDGAAAPADAAIAAAGGAPAAAPATKPVPLDDEAVRALQSALLRIALLEAWRDEVLASGNLAHAAPSMEPTRSGQDDGAVYPPILPEGFEPDHHWHDGKAVLFPDSPDPEDIDPRDLPPEATHPRQVDLFSETGDGAFLGRFTPERRRP